MATWIWFFIFAVGLSFEVWTIWGDRKPGTTLSVHVWALRAQPLTRGLLVGSFAWLVYHFFFEDEFGSMTSVDDWALVVTAFLATLVRRDRKLGR